MTDYVLVISLQNHTLVVTPKTIITPVPTAKNLGFTSDSSLNFEAHTLQLLKTEADVCFNHALQSYSQRTQGADAVLVICLMRIVLLRLELKRIRTF